MCLWVLWAILAKMTESQGDDVMCAMLCLVSQSCLTPCDPLDCSLLGSSFHGDSPGKNTGVGCMPSSRGSSQPSDKTQVSRIAGGFFTEPQGKAKNTGVGSLSLLKGIFLTQELKGGLMHCRWIPYQLSYQGSKNNWIPRGRSHGNL